MSLKFSKKYLLMDKHTYESMNSRNNKKEGEHLPSLSTNGDLLLAEKSRKDVISNLKNSDTDIYSQLEQHAHKMNKFLKELERSRHPQQELYNTLEGINTRFNEMHTWRQREEEAQERGREKKRDDEKRRSGSRSPLPHPYRRETKPERSEAGARWSGKGENRSPIKTRSRRKLPKTPLASNSKTERWMI